MACCQSQHQCHFWRMKPTHWFTFCFQFMVDRIHNNYALQIVANTFLANPTTSATFATILVEYLLARLEEMGCKFALFFKMVKLMAFNLYPCGTYQKRDHSGSVVECLTRDRGAAGSSLASVSALWSLSKTHLS